MHRSTGQHALHHIGFGGDQAAVRDLAGNHEVLGVPRHQRRNLHVLREQHVEHVTGGIDLGILHRGEGREGTPGQGAHPTVQLEVHLPVAIGVHSEDPRIPRRTELDHRLGRRRE